MEAQKVLDIQGNSYKITMLETYPYLTSNVEP